jgi:hypothetical protein
LGFPDRSSQNLTLITRKKDECEFFVVNAEEIPGNRPLERKLAQGARVNLERLQGGRLLSLQPLQ